MAKKWCPELWEPIEVDFQLSEDYYGPSEVKSFYRQEDPSAGYEVRGLKPTYRKIENPERDSY